MAKQKPVKQQVGEWIVRIKATVYKDVYVRDCTQEQAENDPWEHAIEETETSQVDWEVLGVDPDK